MRSRNRLAISKLPEFKAWCEAQGWVFEPTKDPFEVLRGRHPGFVGPMTVFTKLGAKEHLTTWGHSEHVVDRWLASLRQGVKPTSLPPLSDGDPPW